MDLITEILAWLANPVVFSALTILARNLYGWFVNSLKDGAIQGYEWQQLGKTYATILGMALFIFLGVGVVTPVDPEQAVLLAALLDLLRSYFKK